MKVKLIDIIDEFCKIKDNKDVELKVIHDGTEYDIVKVCSDVEKRKVMLKITN